jgi:hypothetical protein
MIRSRVSSRVKRLRAKWAVAIEVMNHIIRHLLDLSNGWSDTLRINWHITWAEEALRFPVVSELLTIRKGFKMKGRILTLDIAAA